MQFLCSCHCFGAQLQDNNGSQSMSKKGFPKVQKDSLAVLSMHFHGLMMLKNCRKRLLSLMLWVDQFGNWILFTGCDKFVLLLCKIILR